jgi:hypothetical protein
LDQSHSVSGLSACVPAAQSFSRLLETQKLLEGDADITLVPPGNELLKQLAAAEEKGMPAGKS